jgi:protein transport protein SEC61 subunit gamma-like protein
MDEQQNPSVIGKLKNFIYKCMIVLRVTKKPSKQEFYTVVKVSAIGMVIIGVIGFAIQMLKYLLMPK